MEYYRVRHTDTANRYALASPDEKARRAFLHFLSHGNGAGATVMPARNRHPVFSATSCRMIRQTGPRRRVRPLLFCRIEMPGCRMRCGSPVAASGTAHVYLALYFKIPAAIRDQEKSMKLNLQNKILLPSLMSLLILIVIGAFPLAHIVVKHLEENTLAMLKAENTVLVKHINGASSSFLDTVQAMTAVPQIRRLAALHSGEAPPDGLDRQALLAQAQALLETFPVSFPVFTQINFAAPDGSVIASSNRHSVGTVHVADRTYFKEAMRGRRLISSPLMSRSIGGKAVMVAVPVRSASGRVCGVPADRAGALPG